MLDIRKQIVRRDFFLLRIGVRNLLLDTARSAAGCLKTAEPMESHSKNDLEQLLESLNDPEMDAWVPEEFKKVGRNIGGVSLRLC